MKKIIFIAVFVLGITAAASAQTNSKAIGIRTGWGAEVSYQHPLSTSTRLEVDLGVGGWNHGGFLLTGTHQWIWNLTGDLDWYAGAGAQLGSVYYLHKDNYWKNSFGLGIAGQIGLQYNFPIPLQLSLDYRPSWFVIPIAKGFAYEGFAVSARYRF